MNSLPTPIEPATTQKHIDRSFCLSHRLHPFVLLSSNDTHKVSMSNREQQQPPNGCRAQHPAKLELVGPNGKPKKGLQKNSKGAETHLSAENLLRKSASSISLSISSRSMPIESPVGSLQTSSTGGTRSVAKEDGDGVSLSTTTSDVHSDEDADSIASRLSQIIIEQEFRMGSQEVLNASDLDPSSSMINLWRSNSSLASLPDQEPIKCASRQDRQPHMLRVQSSGKLERRPTGARIAISSSSDRPTKGSSNLKPSILASPKERVIPEIQLTSSDDGHENKQILAPARTNRDRTRSFSTNVAAVTFKENHMRRNDSAGHLPERGDLRNLENSRREASMAASRQRNRSNTVGEAEKSAMINQRGSEQLMLNIRRSAWTLSEFDQTFNKSELHLSTGSLDSSTNLTGTDYPCSLDPSTQQRNLLVPISERRSSVGQNLLIKASRNATNLGRAQSNTCRLPADHSNGQSKIKCANYSSDEDKREHYRTHSIVSFASSMDSSNSSVNYRRSGRRGQRGRLRRKKGTESEGDGDQESESGCVKRHCINLDTVRQYLPIVEWLPKYKLSLLWQDMFAGMAVAVLNISTSLSAAVVAETDLSLGFRASIVNTFVYAILCSSRHVSFGSWSIMSQMLLVSVQRALSDELILNRLNMGPTVSWVPEDYERWHLNIIVMDTFLIGLVQLVCGLLNLGNILASFIPEALCSSMIAATAFTMAIGQLANMCGTSNKILWSIERNSTDLWADLKDPPLDITDLFADLFRWVQQIALLAKYYDQINLVCVAISCISVILLALNQSVFQPQLERWAKRKIIVPFEMILLILSIIISYLLGLEENYQVITCGPIHLDFTIPGLPNLRLIRELWYQSLATALISYTMVYIMAKTYSNRLNYEVDYNQELIACGTGNLIGGLFDALPATASFSRTAGQVEAGGQTQMASIINCLILVVVARLLGHHVAALPVCVMSAALFYGFVRMMTRVTEVFMYWRICKVDFTIWVVTFVSILTLDIVNGFVYGFLFSILTMLYRAQTRRCYTLGCIGNTDVYVPMVKYPLAEEIDGIKIFQFCGPVHYVCADLFERLLRQKTRVNVKNVLQQVDAQELASGKFNPRELNLPSHIILDFSMISYIDSAGIHVIKKIIEDYQRINVTILLASLASHVARVVKSDQSLWGVYKDRFCVALSDAVHYATRGHNQH